eukprot:CAMPEP_0172779506 /NCGR_PEP_ID=MMETSP1074-20121228/202455_1 /TAXON_ID=2916 /ORGANISM="Ceratium fusus, Strain PA161109" /LENGTH=76 /DNA_ID=CAMNT_0013616469 /DNA_START=1519 /DNA_END=1745 /DNA_ORIENTATION=+
MPLRLSLPAEPPMVPRFPQLPQNCLTIHFQANSSNDLDTRHRSNPGLPSPRRVLCHLLAQEQGHHMQQVVHALGLA